MRTDATTNTMTRTVASAITAPDMVDTRLSDGGSDGGGGGNRVYTKTRVLQGLEMLDDEGEATVDRSVWAHLFLRNERGVGWLLYLCSGRERLKQKQRSYATDQGGGQMSNPKKISESQVCEGQFVVSDEG